MGNVMSGHLLTADISDPTALWYGTCFLMAMSLALAGQWSDINQTCTNGGGINETGAVTQKVGAGLIARTVTLKAVVSLLLNKSLILEA
jgi:hypothetical protein